MIAKRKLFDKFGQKSKCSYWNKIQTDILNEAKHDNTELWKRIGKVGISGIRKIRMEVVLDDGAISYLQKDVLEKWKKSFSSLYDSTECNTERISDETNQNNGLEPRFDDTISIAEVQLAVKKAKNNKASRADSIPVEVYKNDTAIYCLHILFNVCFRTGNIPTDGVKES